MPGFLVGPIGGHSRPSSGRVEYYYTYFWELLNIFVDQNGQSNSESPLIQLQRATTPTFTVNKEQYLGSSLEYKFAKSVTWDDIQLTWYDSVGLLDIVRKWRKSVWTEDRGLSPASTYKKNTTLRSYLPTGKSGVIWLLYNSWPSVIKHGELTYVNSDIKLVEVTVTYDWAEDSND